MAVPNPAPYVKIIDTGVAVGTLFLGLAVFASSVSPLVGLLLVLFLVAVGGGVRWYILADAERIALNEARYQYRPYVPPPPCPYPCTNPYHYHSKEDDRP